MKFQNLHQWRLTLRPILSAALPVVALAIIIFASACSRSNNMGKLHAMWQVMSIEYPDGTVTDDFSPRLYYNFDQNVVQLCTSDDQTQSQGWYAGNVSGEDPDYIFSFPYNETEWNMLKIQPWGIDENPAPVHILELDGKTLRMKLGENIITCRKF